ncbi:MAG: hypothetical protein LBG10_05705, partial [Treponema sp.]|nr:hypothetical protein [Treponema sp.]
MNGNKRRETARFDSRFFYSRIFSNSGSVSGVFDSLFFGAAIQSIKISYKNREVQPKNGQIVGPPWTAGACLDNNLTIF